METWVAVDGHPLLEVTRTGRVRRKERLLSIAPRDHLGRSYGNFRPVAMGGEMAQELGSSGYSLVGYMVAGKRTRLLVHRLVAMAFVAGYFDGATVDHIDGCRTNNNASNLQWVTRADNSRLQNAAGRGPPKGDKNPTTKLPDAAIPELYKMRESGMSLSRIGAVFGVSGSLVHKITSGYRRKK